MNGIGRAMDRGRLFLEVLEFDLMLRCAEPGDRCAVLELCEAQVLRACRHRRQCTSGKDRAADYVRGRHTHRPPVRYRARYQRTDCRAASGLPTASSSSKPTESAMPSSVRNGTACATEPVPLRSSCDSAHFIDRGSTELAYIYDFGDDWSHAVTMEIADADPASPRWLQHGIEWLKHV